MSLRTNKQNAIFHKLIQMRGFDKDEKKEMVEHYSNGRVSSSSQLSVIEMAKLIKHLQVEQNEIAAISRKKMMAKALNLGRDLGMVTGVDAATNFDGINAFGKRMYKVERFSMLNDEQIRNCITGLEKMKSQKKK